MNIGIIAHNSKKSLIEDFCIAYKGILMKHEVYATGTTGRRIEEVTNLHVHKFLPGSVGGDKQFTEMIERGDMDMVIFFYNPTMINPKEPDVYKIIRTCDQYKNSKDENKTNMRVIAGKCRSLPLKTVPGRQTRPTTDRIKETLFNMLQPYLPDARFLDLFAGSGAIGIEALSRGAERAWFVEQNKAAADCIRQNLKFTKLEQQAVLLPMEAHAALQSLQGQEPFDCIFMDPPYDKGLEKDVLYAFRDASFIGEDTLIIVEASLNTDFDWAEDAGYEILKKKIYKTNVHVFLTPKSKHEGVKES